MALWLIALLVVALLGWAAGRAGRNRAATAPLESKGPEPIAGTLSQAEASPEAQSLEKPIVPMGPAVSPERKPNPRPSSAKMRATRERGPPLVQPLTEEDDDAELTLVTTLPTSLRPPRVSGRTVSYPPPSRPSKVEVIYEDEADIDTSPVQRILVSAEGQSDGGRVRRRNEDSFLVLQERSLFVVADGMGGYVGGDVASALAVDTIATAFETNTFEGRTESAENVPRRGREMACAIQMANQAILDRVAREPALAQMGTTLVAARFSPNRQRVYVGHVGDSRCYRLRGNTIKQLTTDHTFLGLGLKGRGEQHLYQAIGIDRRISIDIVVDKPRPDDLYLLCTDGLTKMATDDQIRDVIVAEPDLECAVYGLIELANDSGGKDNVTVILVKVMERQPSLANVPAARPGCRTT